MFSWKYVVVVLEDVGEKLYIFCKFKLNEAHDSSTTYNKCDSVYPVRPAGRLSRHHHNAVLMYVLAD